MEQPILYDPAIHSHLLPSLTALHSTCILTPPYLIGEFLPPLDDARILSWWTDRSAEVVAGEREIILQLVPKLQTGENVDEKKEQEQEVIGVVMLGMPVSETAPFKGEIGKLLVAPQWRGQGIARTLVKMLEGVAVARGKGLLVIVAEKGAPGETIYPGWGYSYMGMLPKSEISPLDGSLKDGIYFYKDLRGI